MQDHQMNTGQYNRVTQALSLDFPVAIGLKLNGKHLPMFSHH